VRPLLRLQNLPRDLLSPREHQLNQELSQHRLRSPPLRPSAALNQLRLRHRNRLNPSQLRSRKRRRPPRLRLRSVRHPSLSARRRIHPRRRNRQTISRSDTPSCAAGTRSKARTRTHKCLRSVADNCRDFMRMAPSRGHHRRSIIRDTLEQAIALLSASELPRSRTRCQAALTVQSTEV
jgi:hypothetical protein